MPNPSPDSGGLLLRLFDMRREPRLEKARQWFLSSFQARDIDEFREVCPPNWESFADFHLVISFWQTVAALINTGLLDPDLFFRADLELLAVWAKFAHLVPEMRSRERNPGLYGDFEAAAALAKQYLDKQGPDAYDMFVAKYQYRPD